MLAGARPYRLKRASAAELEEAIATVEPPLASDTAADRRVARQLRGRFRLLALTSSPDRHAALRAAGIVPLPGNRCSVVWVAAPKEAERLMALGDDDLSAAAERQSHSIFGRVAWKS